MLRNFIARQIAKAGFIKAEQLPRWLLNESQATQWQMPDPSVYGNQADLYRKLSYIGTVVDIVTQACIAADIDVVDSNGVEDDNHPFIRLLANPNPYDSRTEFLRGHFAWRLITGNSYWWLNRSSETADPDEVWILPPSKIIPVADGTMGLKGYLYTPGDGSQIPLEPWEVIHFKNFNPFNRYLGLSAIESLAITAYGAIAAQDWNTKLFAENNARLPGILAFKQMISDPDWERIKRDATDNAKKRQNMMLRGVGDGVEWIQSAVSQREMEFLAGLDSSKRDIYDRLAPGLYNMLTSNSSLANGETGAMAFQKFTVQPVLRETSDKLNSVLMPTYNDNMRVEYEDVVPEDKAMKLAEIENFAKFHTVDEVRVEMYGNNPDPDPERGKMFVAQLTAAKAEKKPEVEQKPKPKPEPMEVEDSNDDMPVDVKMDLNRWRRKATNNVGKPLSWEFTSEVIPADMHKQIVSSLKACKSKDEVVSVFKALKPVPMVEPAQDVEAIKSLAASLDKFILTATATGGMYYNIALDGYFE